MKTLLNIIQSVLAAFIGIQKNSKFNDDDKFIEKNGFCVVAPIKTIKPLSTLGIKISCWALLKRWISSKNSIESKLLNGPYDIFIIGKKNNLNNSLIKSKISEKIEKGKNLKIADEKIVYFTKINDEFLIYDSDKYKIPEKYLYHLLLLK